MDIKRKKKKEKRFRLYLETGLAVLLVLTLALAGRAGLLKSGAAGSEPAAADAQKEAEEKIAQAEEERGNMINEHEITKRAYQQAEEIVEASKKVARDMKIGAKEYADELLQQVDEQMKRMGEFTSGSVEGIMKDYQQRVQSFNAGLEQKRQILQQNRKELNVNRSNN